MKRICIFVHFNKDNFVSEYDIAYLAEIYNDITKNIILISTSKNLSNQKTLKKYCTDIIIRENKGYDFYSWKEGLLKHKEIIKESDELLLCNNSVYKLSNISLAEVFREMEKRKEKKEEEREDYNFWGITDSKVIAYHLQSYFLLFRKEVITSDVFWRFWQEVEIIEDKYELIKKYEIELSQTLIKNNFKASAYIKIKESKNKILIKMLCDNLFGLLRCKNKEIKILKKLHNNKRFFKPISILKFIKQATTGYFTNYKKTDKPLFLWHTLLKNKSPFIKKSLFSRF